MAEPKSVEYSQMLTQWIDDCWPKITEFKKQYPQTVEGTFRYLLTIHVMMLDFCQRFHAPPEQFSNLLTTAMGVWFKHGKPEDFDLCLVLLSPQAKEDLPN